MKEIEDFFKATSLITISEMYLNNYSYNINESSLKEYNPGHLGTSININFILANLFYFLNSNNLSSKLVIGTGHAGASLLANLWLNGTLEKYNDCYNRDINGLNNLIKDFGTKIRSEINPEYPNTIYDGGELGYSLGVAYGYAINGEEDIVPCIIGDGEAETGCICASWQLARILNTKAKVLPIINLNGLKMTSSSYLSTMSDDELNNYFRSLGYNVEIVYADQNIQTSINNAQLSLSRCLNYKNPLIIFKASKGFDIPIYSGDIKVHKNPLYGLDKKDKLEIIKKFIDNYKVDIFNKNGSIQEKYNLFSTIEIKNEKHPVNKVPINNCDIDTYLYNFLKLNKGIVFSPDEIVSNGYKKCSNISIEILNEQLLQAIYQGYVQSGKIGCFVSYEGFMPILSSMITQYYKFLKQKKSYSEKCYSLNYILTSTCFENTYSHQNPDFVNSLYEKDDEFYNIYYPKDMASVVKCYENISSIEDKINIINYSKRHYKSYGNPNLDIETITECENPKLILCCTGDYMLDQALKVYELLKTKNVRVVYITKPQILNPNNKDCLDDIQFKKYFDNNIPVIYLYQGYSSTIKSLIYDRFVNVEVIGYKDGITSFGNLNNNLKCNNLEVDDIIELYKKKIKKL